MIFKGTRQLLDLPRVTLLTSDNVLKLVCHEEDARDKGVYNMNGKEFSRQTCA